MPWRRKRIFWTDPFQPKTYANVLGDKLLEYWDARFGVTPVSGEADTWTGRVIGGVANAPGPAQRPPYAIDSGFFSELPVVQCNKLLTGTARYLTYTLPVPWPVTQRPALLTVARYRTTVSVQGRIGSDNFELMDSMPNIAISGYTASATVAVLGTFTADNYALPDTNARLTCVGRTPTHVEGWVNGQKSNATPIPRNQNFSSTIPSIGFGAQTSSGFGVGDVSLAMVFLCHSMPTDYEQLQLYALAKADWGI